jgi:MYXO-CTERM domain-containing protein
VPPSDAAIIHVGSTSGEVGQPDLSIDVSLEVPSTATQVAGTQNDITFSGGIGAAIQIKAKANGKPDCAVNETIDKGGTSFAFQPSGCSGEACTGVRALVLALDNTCPICGTATEACPSVSACPQVLYTCKIQINGTAATGTDYPLTCSNPGASDPAGQALTTSCTDGKVTVGGVIVPTPTFTVEPTATNTPGVTATATVTATNTTVPTATKKATNTPSSHSNDDDGCAVTSPANSGSGWMLLLPAAALLWIRRRQK